MPERRCIYAEFSTTFCGRKVNKLEFIAIVSRVGGVKFSANK